MIGLFLSAKIGPTKVAWNLTRIQVISIVLLIECTTCEKQPGFGKVGSEHSFLGINHSLEDLKSVPESKVQKNDFLEFTRFGGELPQSRVQDLKPPLEGGMHKPKDDHLDHMEAHIKNPVGSASNINPVQAPAEKRSFKKLFQKLVKVLHKDKGKKEKGHKDHKGKHRKRRPKHQKHHKSPQKHKKFKWPEWNPLKHHKKRKPYHEDIKHVSDPFVNGQGNHIPHHFSSRFPKNKKPKKTEFKWKKPNFGKKKKSKHHKQDHSSSNYNYYNDGNYYNDNEHQDHPEPQYGHFEQGHNENNGNDYESGPVGNGIPENSDSGRDLGNNFGPFQGFGDPGSFGPFPSFGGGNRHKEKERNPEYQEDEGEFRHSPFNNEEDEPENQEEVGPPRPFGRRPFKPIGIPIHVEPEDLPGNGHFRQNEFRESREHFHSPRPRHRRPRPQPPRYETEDDDEGPPQRRPPRGHFRRPPPSYDEPKEEEEDEDEVEHQSPQDEGDDDNDDDHSEESEYRHRPPRHFRRPVHNSSPGRKPFRPRRRPEFGPRPVQHHNQHHSPAPHDHSDQFTHQNPELHSNSINSHNHNQIPNEYEEHSYPHSQPENNHQFQPIRHHNRPLSRPQQYRVPIHRPHPIGPSVHQYEGNIEHEPHQVRPYPPRGPLPKPRPGRRPNGYHPNPPPPEHHPYPHSDNRYPRRPRIKLSLPYNPHLHQQEHQPHSQPHSQPQHLASGLLPQHLPPRPRPGQGPPPSFDLLRPIMSQQPIPEAQHNQLDVPPSLPHPPHRRPINLRPIRPVPAPRPRPMKTQFRLPKLPVQFQFGHHPPKPLQKEPNVIYGTPVKPSSQNQQKQKHPFANAYPQHNELVPHANPPRPEVKLPIPFKPLPTNNHLNNPHSQPHYHHNLIGQSTEQVSHSPASSQEVQEIKSPSKYSTLPQTLDHFKPDPDHKHLPKLTYDATKRGGPKVNMKSNRQTVRFTAEDAFSKRKLRVRKQ